MTTVVVPYHQDERLPAGVLPLPAGEGQEVVRPDLPDGDRWQRIAALHAAAAERVAAWVHGGGTATVVSGDCLVAMAALAGAQRAGHDPAVVWFDAHGDVHTLESSTSGYLGGVSLRLLLGANPERLAEPLGVRPVAEDRVLLVGARDLDPPELAYLSAARVGRSTVEDLHPTALPDGPLLLHVDVDVVDPAELPGLLFPAPGGPGVAQTVDALRRVVSTGRVVVLDLALPWHPTTDARVERLRADLLRQLLDAQPPG